MENPTHRDGSIERIPPKGEVDHLFDDAHLEQTRGEMTVALLFITQFVGGQWPLSPALGRGGRIGFALPGALGSL